MVRNVATRASAGARRAFSRLLHVPKANAVPVAVPSKPASGGKRKAEQLDVDDFENVDPLLFAKRSKGANPGTPKDMLKPSSFVLTKAPLLSAIPSSSTPAAVTPLPDIRSLGSPSKANSTPRRILQGRTPAARINAGIAKSSPASAPAGRSPTRGKRSGILNRRRSGPYTRVDPPSFNLDSAAPFSLDAALKGTIPGYESRAQAPRAAPVESVIPELHQDEMKPGWFFDIHEDTPEQEMTNLLQHSTCTLDISSDEESEQKARREKDEGRDKENVPPMDDVSQTSARRGARATADEMLVEKERVALGEMNTADFFADGCDESSIIIIPADEEETVEPVAAPQPQPLAPVEPEPVVESFEFAPALEAFEPALAKSQAVDALMGQTSSSASVLQPIEGTGESFELWESGSAKDEAEVAVEAS
jgi:hypothetical protein